MRKRGPPRTNTAAGSECIIAGGSGMNPPSGPRAEGAAATPSLYAPTRGSVKPHSSRSTPSILPTPRAQRLSTLPPTSSSALPSLPTPTPTGATNIDEDLAIIKRQRHEMPGFGNCLSESLAHALSYLPEEGHPHFPRLSPLKVRQRIANEDWHNQGWYFDSIPHIHMHLTEIGRPGVWMDEPDVLAASYASNTNIVGHRLNQNPIHYFMSANAPTINLAYVNGNHYDCVRPEAPWQLVPSGRSTRRLTPIPPPSLPPTHPQHTPT